MTTALRTLVSGSWLERRKCAHNTIVKTCLTLAATSIVRAPAFLFACAAYQTVFLCKMHLHAP